jgi:hypothetical protein
MLYEAVRGDMSIAVVGDAMLSRRLRPYREPDFLKLVELLRNADLSIANLEFLFHDFEHAWQWTGGTYTRSDPKNLSELKWMGINAVLTANNHSYDFSEGGYFTTLKHLEEHDIPHAGGGKDLDHVGFEHFLGHLAGGTGAARFPRSAGDQCPAPSEDPQSDTGCLRGLAQGQS